jgi:hypothetical protein
MSRDPSPDQPAPDHLRDADFVFRAASQPSHLTEDPLGATSEAYHRRSPEHPRHDWDGISLGLTPRDAIIRLNPRRVGAIFRLSVGEVRALRVEGSDRVLDVNPSENNPGHAYISNLPYYDPVNRKAELNEANAWAEKLRSISRILPEDQIQNR